MTKILMGQNFAREGFASLEGKFEVIYPEKDLFSKADIIERIADIDVLVPNFSFQTDAEIIDAGKNLKLIANYGVGYNNIDVAYAASKGITVTNTPQSVLEPTAELCFALIVATARKVAYYNHKLHSGERLNWGLFGDLGMPIYGKTLGIYGMGRIGQAVARRAVASGMKIIYHNRHRLAEDIESRYNAVYVDFDTLLAESDVLSLNAPSTAETHHLMGEEQFRKMKDTAILINTARGALVDESALAVALRRGDIWAAGLDVFEREPKILPELLELDNAIVCPHAGTKTYAARLDMELEVAKNIINFFEGGEIDKVN
ncbi:lactate dehydrogenase-like 2-hydroxyacid dehydrogenase [Dysgonomonas sp. PFB1-18]|uniref:NAD(P)-dependent oxidoreductase n=1 Tax=unclassified Dysgonomonas TaxID=2630389 RepID=UPI002476C759|nr:MULTISPECIES: NAD(P)-dependent oxidoreductase [unclassified Dysgonomonas]MDH6307207.1 lactate dehydrogenase-like 2-hydroxyacid dehydrogenase [Dysgonomonas sp. PF1-14]MDH6337126.1 lactate dehydrogenase-like 2-hydroxyacid dehydrogenase [Dysgonomonas sp. PF1-16]MDH6381112.1 lactate dehydrogenase-like 2-hydroxyacid dehydrogenase [Dysgonomonas sp. PFB1-18]MDH6396309.1 lactate dehydrogenase-like 2-hydroxyacid dehydrogenase [Dysgonomonas sp. PF1-23]